MLRHLGCGDDLENFPGTRYEQLALIHKACGRGLVEWQEERGRYQLTSIGWRQLTPRRFGLPSLMVSTAMGASIGAAALAFLWLPGVQWQDSAHGQTNALVSRLEKPIAAPAFPLADAGGRNLAPMQASASPVAPAAVTPGAGPSAAPANPIEPAQIAGQPVREQPGTEAAPAVVKQAAVKKSRHTTGRGSPLAFTNPYRDERYSGFGRIFR